MTTSSASYDGSIGAAPVAATGSHGTALIYDGSVLPVLSDALPYRGTTALRWTSSTTGVGAQNVGPGVSNNGFFRQYVRIIGTPQGRFEIARRPLSSNPTAGDWYASQLITVGTDRKLSVHMATLGWDVDASNADGDTYPGTRVTGATAIPNDQWVRVEGTIRRDLVAVKLWLNPASTGTPDVDISVADLLPADVAYEAYWIGAGRIAGGVWSAFAPTGGVVEVDEFAFDTAGYPGPLTSTWTSTAPLDVTVSLTAAATVTTAAKTSTAPLDVAVSLTADGVTERTSDAPLDVTVSLTAAATVTTAAKTSTAPLDVAVSLTAEASSTSDSDPRWGTPETWGDLWGWWTLTPTNANDGVAPVGFALTAEGAAVAPKESTAPLDVTMTLGADGVTERTEASALDVTFTLAAEGVTVDGALNPASLSVGVTIDAVGYLASSSASSLNLGVELAATGAVVDPDGPAVTTLVSRPGAYATFRFGARSTH